MSHPIVTVVDLFQVYETPFYVAVDHEKKKVVISIRGTLSPKVSADTLGRPGTLSGESGTFLTRTWCLTYLKHGDLFFQDALTDLTGDAERLPVEGHHGTWLGHKVCKRIENKPKTTKPHPLFFLF